MKPLCFLLDESLINQIENIDSLSICKSNISAVNYDLYTKLSLIGLELQKILFSTNMIWGEQKIPKVIIFFQPLHDRTLKEIVDFIDDFRGDEIALNIDSNISWVAGHARAIIKWSLPMTKIKDIIPARELKYFTNDTNYERLKLIWWAERLNLKIYSL